MDCAVNGRGGGGAADALGSRGFMGAPEELAALLLLLLLLLPELLTTVPTVPEPCRAEDTENVADCFCGPCVVTASAAVAKRAPLCDVIGPLAAAPA